MTFWEVILGLIGVVVIATPIVGFFWLVKRLFLGKPEAAPPGCTGRCLHGGDTYKAPNIDMSVYWD